MDSEEKSLKQQTIFSLLWNAFDKVGFQVIAFIIGLITMRMLSPRDFGLIGALAIFTAISNILIESGFTSAMVRRKGNTQEEYTAILIFNLLLSLSFYLMLFIGADAIANYYQMPELVNLSRFLFLNILFNSFCIVQNIILTKELAFKKLSVINIIAALVSGVATLLLIWQGYGYWALAWQILLQNAIKSILLWIVSSWRPCLHPDFRIIKEVFSFSVALIGSSLINTFVRYVYNPIIGRRFGEEQLGYYSEAYKFFFLPSNIVANTLSGVSYPVLSKLNEETNRQLLYLRKMVRLSAFGIFPILIGAMMCFDNLVETILTDKWKAIIPYFQILAIGGTAIPFHSLFLGVMTLKGYPKRNFAMELIRNLLILCPLFILHSNINAMLWSFSIANLCSMLIDMFFIRKVMAYSFGQQLRDILPYLAISLAMGLIVYSINFITINAHWQLLLQVGIGGCFYLVGCYLSGSVIVRDAVKSLRAGLPRRA